MTILTTNSQALPDLDPAAPPDGGSHRKASATGWAVAAITLGLIFETGRLADVEPLPARLALIGLLLPLLAAGAQVLRLLGLAAAAVVGAPDPGIDTGDTDLLLAGLETRDLWVAQAQAWVLGSSAGFLAWTIVLQFLARGA
jgi:hypothetical protein